MTFYLKYRSKTVEELDILEVREALKGMIAAGNIPHAILFSGPRGAGKTSAARILAKAVNCENPTKEKEPCNKCVNCLAISKGDNLDVIEIDAASHRGIDDIRGLRDAVKLAPTSLKMKVYIIDEAHMLTLEASNALLKTLEEPPSHVMFILATTNPEKLIETIRSRTTNVNFRKANREEIIRALTRVTRGEHIKADKDALEVIADMSDGSFRDAVKLLEQLTLSKKAVTKKDVEKLLLGGSDFDANLFLKHLVGRDAKSMVSMIEKASNGGLLAKNMVYIITTNLKDALLAKVGVGSDKLADLTKSDIIELLSLLGSASASSLNFVIDQVALEAALISWCGEGSTEKSGEEPKVEAKPKKLEEAQEKVVESKVNKNQTVTAPKNFLALNHEIWQKVMALIRPINASTEALLRASHPLNFDGKILTLGVYYKFHKERLEESTHRRVLEDIISSVLGSEIRVVCTLSEPPAKPQEEVVSDSVTPEVALAPSDTILTEAKDTDIIKIAQEVFGS